MQDWGFNGWGRSWNIWRENIATAEITGKDGSKTTVAVKGDEPPAAVKELYALSASLLQVSPADAVKVVLPKIKKSMAENYWYIVALEKIKQPLIVNAKLGNVPSSECVAIAADFSGEQFFFKK
jgi:peptide/nickel transport system substrate-binding protein